jgi:hypothetical protein
MRLALAALFALLAAPALAQSGPTGIGFAQAEEGLWFCRGDTPEAALNCARDKCRAEGAGQDCYRTAWCYPARWSGTMLVWQGEFHGMTPLCGAPSREAVSAALEQLCTGNEFATSCELILTIDPDGVEQEGGGLVWDGPAATPPPPL